MRRAAAHPFGLPLPMTKIWFVRASGSFFRQAPALVVGEAVDGADAVALARRMLSRRAAHGYSHAAQRWHRGLPRACGRPRYGRCCGALFLTTFDIDEYVYDALAAGASGLLKDVDPDDLAQAIRVVHEGNALIQPSITRRLVETYAASRQQGALRWHAHL